MNKDSFETEKVMEFEELKRVGTMCQTEQRAHPLPQGLCGIV